MADTKISALPASTTPLAGTEVLPLVQSGATKKVAVSDLTTGRSVSFASATSSQNVSTGFIAYSAINTSTANTTGKVIAVMSAKGYDTVGTPKDVTLIQYEPLDANNVNGDLVIKNRVGDALATVARFTANDYKIETGNVVIGTSGKGIDFSATPGTGTSELLADYEEGTWTPTLLASTTDFTSVSYFPGAVTGRYTKVGNLVTVQGCMRTVAITVGSAAGNLRIGGLPFTAANIGYSDSCIEVAAVSSFATNQPIGGRVVGNTTQIELEYRLLANGATSSMGYAEANTGYNVNLINFSATYRV